MKVSQKLQNTLNPAALKLIPEEKLDIIINTEIDYKIIPKRFHKLVPDEELQIYESKIQFSETPIWKYWIEFVFHRCREDGSHDTTSGVQDVLKFVLRHLNIYSIEDLNNHHLLREKLHLQRQKRGWAFGTFNDYLKDIGTYFIWLEMMEYVEENKIKKVRKCSTKDKLQPTLNDNEILTIKGYFVQNKKEDLITARNRFFIGLLTVTGARPVELEALKCTDIKKFEDTYMVVIHGKKQKGKIVPYPFPPFLKDSFEKYMKIRDKLKRFEPPLLISQSKITGWTRVGMRNLMRKLSKELGFKINMRMFRRWVATHLYREGWSKDRIADHLRHRRTSTTDIYIKMTCHLTKDTVGTLDKLISGDKLIDN